MREVGGGADRWGPGVSGWARQLPGRRGARGCWAGLSAKLGRAGEGRRAGLLAAVLGRGKELGQRKEENQRAESEERRNGRKFSFFLFINKIFKLNFKRFLRSFSI